MSITLHHNEKINTQWWILILGVVLMLIKFLAFHLTQSTAILSDALESIVNIIAGSFGLYSLYLSAKPRDHDHPYGHGKIEFISSTIEGMMIIGAGFIIIGKSTYHLIHPKAIEELGIGITLIAFSGILNYAMGVFASKKGQTNHSLALEASGEHLKSDAYTTVGILAGLLVIFLTDLYWLDSIVAILVSFIIILSGVKILRKSIAGIMDEQDFELNVKVIDYINQNRKVDWIDVHNFRVIKYGEVIHVDCHMTMPWYYTLQQSHDGMKLLEECLEDSVENPVEAFIHVDPCMPKSCTICEIQGCLHRVKPFEKRIEWTLDNVSKNQKHHYKQ